MAHYAALLVFAFACWGIGRAMLACVGAPPWRDLWLEGALAVTAGIGVFICFFQALGIAGVFKAPWVLAGTGAGVVLGAWQWPAWRRQWRARPHAGSWTRGERWAVAMVALVALPTLLAPLGPPRFWDEVMYHLPYARQVAQSGTLGIHEWLRYPWFPYNYNLLFAAGMTVYDDVFTHLLVALAGWLSTLMVYRLGLRHADRITACIAAAIWIGLGDYRGALIDTAVALFVLSACAALWWWHEACQAAMQPGRIPQEDRSEWARAGAAPSVLRAGKTGWLVLAAFFLGLAAGSKYQALTFLPLLALFVVWRERRMGVWSLMLLVFLIPCIYWYGRNAWMTGDPFNPLGGRLLGFSGWNLADYQHQIEEVHSHANPPNGFFWALLWVPFTAAWKRSSAVRAVVIFSAYSLILWALTSRYPRYLMAAFPLLALGAAVGWRSVLAGVQRRVSLLAGRQGSVAKGLILGAYGLGAAVLLAYSAKYVAQAAQTIAPESVQRGVILARYIPGYEVFRFLREHPGAGRIYIVGLSDAVYYAPNPVYGDVFGPWRYADFLGLPPDRLAQKLRDQGFDTLVVHTGRPPLITAQAGFEKYFELLYEKDGTQAYRIRSIAP